MEDVVDDLEKRSVADLEREAALIRAWIRDLTAPKQARLRQIRAELERRAAMVGETVVDGARVKDERAERVMTKAVR